MSHRLSKEELDEQFEQFLKESLSDDSFDSNRKSAVLENLGKPKVKRIKKKDSSPWWNAEDDSDDGGHQPRSYLKQKKQQSSSSVVLYKSESDDRKKPVTSCSLEPDPRSLSLNRTLEKCKALEQFYKSKSNFCLDPLDDSLSSDCPDSPDDLAGTSRSFLKSQSTSQPIEEVEEEDQVEEMQQSIDPLITSIEKDSLEIDESVLASGPNHSLHVVGLDTLEEQEEKERFFARLENGASSTVDYSKLKKELDSTDSSQLTICNVDHAKAEEDENKDLSVNYSEDFEDVPEDSKKPEKNEDLCDNPDLSNQAIQKEEKPGMLAKVMLIDSMDSTIDTHKLLQQTGEDDNESVTPKVSNDALGTGISNQYTNSDMEALHQAYQTLDQSLEDADEKSNYLKTTDHTSASFGDTDSKAKNLKTILTGNSELSTVDDLMQIYRGDKYFTAESLRIDGKSESGDLDYQSNVSMMAQGSQHQELYVSSSKTSLPEMFAVHQGEKSSHVARFGNGLAVHTSTSSGLLHNRSSNKTVKSLTSPLSKVHNTKYAYVKSSGYGKAGFQIKESTSTDKLPSMESKKGKSPTDQKPKGILSSTKTIRFSENVTSFPTVYRSSTALQHHETAAQTERDISMDCQQTKVPINPHQDTPENTPAINDSIISGNNMDVLYKVEANAGHMLCKKEMEEMKAKYDEEIQRLKRENFLLQMQLQEEEEKIKKESTVSSDKNAPVTKEKMQQIRKEIEEQETILKGYQLENEKLFKQIKVLQQEKKITELQMFTENQSLKADIVSLREQLKGITNTQHKQSVSHGSEYNNQHNTELMTELRALQRKETVLNEEIARYKQDKQVLEVDLEQMRKECILLKTQLSNSSDDKSYEIKVMEETHKQEINRLNKKLQWFAENQAMLDRDTERLKNAYEQIENLKIQVKKLQCDAGVQPVQQQKLLQDRAADTKQIKDLQRQVKEMESIIKRRHPNSIPALVFAAAAVSDNPANSNTVSFLEKRIKQLETDLENKDEDAKKSLRSMEQQFQIIKIQYESRIKELEALPNKRPLNENPNHGDTAIKMKALEQELSIFKDAHHSTVMSLQKEIKTLKENNLFLSSKLMDKDGTIHSDNKRMKTPDKTRLTKLSQELAVKNKEIQELSKTVERLQKERMSMLSVKPHSSYQNNLLSEPEQATIPPYIGSTAHTEMFPTSFHGKVYQPEKYKDVPGSDLQHKNQRLAMEVNKMSEDLNIQKENSEYAIQRLECETAEQVEALKQAHLREIEKLSCQLALERSSSRTSELTHTISTQEILIKHLQNQVRELQKDRESLAVLRIREETLQTEVIKLLAELKTAKECHSPEMKHFSYLENKIKHMEIRHSQRVQELQQIIQQSHRFTEDSHIEEINKWKMVVKQKNADIDRFRRELDVLLDGLSELQRQGVVIPISASQGL